MSHSDQKRDLRRRDPGVWSEMVPNEGMWACSRLFEVRPDYSHPKIWEFVVPSKKDRPGENYLIRVRKSTLEAACCCKRFKDFREAVNSPVRKVDEGHYIEWLAHSKGIPFYPTLLRREKGLCRHLKLVRRWLQRHGYNQEAMRQLAEKVEKKIDEFDTKQAAREAAGSLR